MLNLTLGHLIEVDYVKELNKKCSSEEYFLCRNGKASLALVRNERY